MRYKKHRTIDSLDELDQQRCDSSSQVPWFTWLTTLTGFSILYLIGYFEDVAARLLRFRGHSHLRCQQGYAPLMDSFDDFFTRKFKNRIDDCFARPTSGIPGSQIRLIDIPSKFRFAQIRPWFGRKLYLNVGSYNYLDLIKLPKYQTKEVELTVRTLGSQIAVPQGMMSHSLREQAEAAVASFLRKPAALVCSMGFATNVSAIEVLMKPGDLILSDELNHASIRFASRLCGAQILTFAHNNMVDLECQLRAQISSQRPPSKIMVVVEGLYSMEGTLCDLPRLIRLRKKYKFYLFVDEAHSIGALGSHGQGICEHFNVPTDQVDILMGTFSKSFGAVGGYVAAGREVIEAIRHGPSMMLAEQPTPCVLAQVQASLALIQSPLGRRRIQQLRENTLQLRGGLKNLGFTVYGHAVSPVIPILIYQLGKLAAFSREMLTRGIAVVVVGYPATPLHSARARLCVSAGHTSLQIQEILRACDEVGDVLQLKHQYRSMKQTSRQPLER